MKVLFICNQNENRSKTAEAILGDKFDVRSAGLYNEKPVSKKQISWADTIIVMEESQRSELAKRFPKEYMQKRILSMEIPDIYRYNQPELISALQSKINENVLNLPTESEQAPRYAANSSLRDRHFEITIWVLKRSKLRGMYPNCNQGLTLTIP